MERPALLRRIGEVVRARTTPVAASGPSTQRMDDLQARLDHLESLVEGLQDAVHREAVRHREELDELRRRLEPAEIARALTDDARRRGL